MAQAGEPGAGLEAGIKVRQAHNPGELSQRRLLRARRLWDRAGVGDLFPPDAGDARPGARVDAGGPPPVTVVLRPLSKSLCSPGPPVTPPGPNAACGVHQPGAGSLSVLGADRFPLLIA